MTGAGILLRRFLRRDRGWCLWFGLGSALLYVSQAWSVDGLYPTRADFERAAAGMADNPALVAMAGPARALDTTGGQVTWQASAFGAVLAGLVTMVLIVRHTRAEEESGRDELIRAAPVGRHATSAAALGVALVASAAAGLLVAGSLVGYGLAVADSAALGVGLMLTGWFFAGTALLSAQLTASTRAAYGLAGTVIGLAYALRAVGDVSLPVLSWLSPIGWYQAMHPFSGLRWWPALLLVAGTAVSCAAAYLVFDRRDHGAGVLAVRAGPARAGRGLRTGAGLAWRLQRGPFRGWLAGLLLAGLAFGAMGEDVGDLVGDSDLSRDLLLQGGGSVVDAFYATVLGILALLAAASAVGSAQRPHGEEEAGRLEPLLAAGLGRNRWLAGHVLVTVGGTVVLLVAAGWGLGLGLAVATGEWAAVGRYPVDLVTYLPAVLVLSGVTRFLHGVAPRATRLGWAGLVLAAVVLVFGAVLRLPQWLQDLSPLEHVAAVPAEAFRWPPFLLLAALATLLSVAGQIGFARRDIH